MPSGSSRSSPSFGASRWRHHRCHRTAAQAATKSAEGDRIVTWGDPENGGDSSAVQDKFQKVQQICATTLAFAVTLVGTALWSKVSSADYAFAAILVDGTVVTWGHPSFGGNSTAVQAQLRNVQKIYSTWLAFAILADGSVVTWGDPDDGGDSTSVRDQLTNVQQVCAMCFCCHPDK